MRPTNTKETNQTMNTNHTYAQIANDYTLWLELVDIDGNMSRETFDATPVAALVDVMIDMFGPEEVLVEIFENNVWATDAFYCKGGFATGAQLLSNEDASEVIYAQIEASIAENNTEGVIGKFSWQVVGK